MLGFLAVGCISFESYIKPQPKNALRCPAICCISFESYIKPQLGITANVVSNSCISFESYIKPQRKLETACRNLVVYLLNPTSNHNCLGIIIHPYAVVYLLNPTSNHNGCPHIDRCRKLYIF